MASEVLVAQLVHIIDRFAMAMRVVQIAPTSIIEKVGSGVRAKAIFKIELKSEPLELKVITYMELQNGLYPVRIGPERPRIEQLRRVYFLCCYRREYEQACSVIYKHLSSQYLSKSITVPARKNFPYRPLSWIAITLYCNLNRARLYITNDIYRQLFSSHFHKLS